MNDEFELWIMRFVLRKPLRNLRWEVFFTAKSLRRQGREENNS